MRKLVLQISGGVSLLVCLILFLVIRSMGNAQDSQQMAERWSDKNNVAQVSCFFSVSAGMTEDAIEEFEHAIDGALREASITLETMHEGEVISDNARLWVGAYSAAGRITLSSSRTSLDAEAVGIGGDFFLFHPLRLVSGAYFSGNDLMQDYCVIDEDAAWQLFGSNDVVGQTVDIRGIPHMITGVVERPTGRLEEAAGLSSTVVYVSYQTLSELGTDYGINHYEIVMPNPVSGFALQYVKEHIGVAEKHVEVVENSARYSLVNSLKKILAFGTRSMNGKAIIYPYWENVARGYEDIIALLTLFLFLFLLYPVILAVVWFVRWWRHKGWTLKDAFYAGKDKWELYLERRRAKKLAGKGTSGKGTSDKAGSGEGTSDNGMPEKKREWKLPRWLSGGHGDDLDWEDDIEDGQGK
ncbi:MAG: ABC transporter permease [Candidatus Gastranaerophilales bacterium]|nr:ABC transporter permease [Candidatus Gastranaerophilales bacterium]